MKATIDSIGKTPIFKGLATGNRERILSALHRFFEGEAHVPDTEEWEALTFALSSLAATRPSPAPSQDTLNENQLERRHKAFDVVIKYLLGEENLDGYAFGQERKGVGPYWWRAHLRRLYDIVKNNPIKTTSPALNAEVVEKLKKVIADLETGPRTQSKIMKAWDDARQHFIAYAQGTFPREVFEGYIDEIQDDLNEALQLLEAAGGMTHPTDMKKGE